MWHAVCGKQCVVYGVWCVRDLAKATRGAHGVYAITAKHLVRGDSRQLQQMGLTNAAAGN